MAQKRYFEVADDVYIKGRWHLVDPTDQTGANVCDALHQGTSARVAAPVRLQHSDAAERGKPLDYTRITGGLAPIVNMRVAEILERLAPHDFELIPAKVDGFSEPYFVVNILKVSRCIDERESRQVDKYTEEDREFFPDKVGSYFLVMGLKLDKSKIRDEKVFWTWGWKALIFSEEIKKAFEAARVTGAKFVEV